MWLDELKELVGTLKERIEQHNEVLSKNETATRYALIDPLLTALGWNLQDPGQVQTEYSTGDGRADYAMFSRGDTNVPRLVIEAKKLGRPIGDGINQSITYCVGRGIPYFVVTNGGDWSAYETHRPVPVTEKRIVDFNLMDPAQTSVMKMLWLWPGNFELESPIMPVVPDRLASRQTAPSTPQPPTAEPPQNVKRSDRGIPFDEFNPSSGTGPPAALLFPDGEKKKIVKWTEVQISVVEWLLGTGRLTDADCPIKSRGGRQILVSTRPARSNGSSFGAPKQIGDVWVDGKRSAPDHIRVAKSILKARNVDPSQVRIVTKT